jgi:MarR family transcriptional regulator, transcriptional regulator for hemolysin
MPKVPLEWKPTEAPTFWINQASRAVLRRFDERLRPLGFGTAYFPVVTVLLERGAMRPKDMLPHVNIEQPTMTALLARMERDGLIKRKVDPDDARAQRVSLTPKAKSIFEQVIKELQLVVDVALQGVSEAEQATLIRTLQKVVQNLAAPGSAPSTE